MQLEAVGIPHHRDMCVVEAESLMARFAVEVAVHFVDAAGVVVATQTVFCRAAAVFDFVDDMLFGKQSQCAEDRGFVHRVERNFDIIHAECVMKLLDGFVYQYAYSGRSYIVLTQDFFAVGRCGVAF